MKRKAKLSIVAPVYNKAAWIAETIKSLEEQSMEDIEILFIDDGSTDDTVEVIRHYQKFDKRIRLHRLRKNQGLSKAWNKGISLAKTPIILVASGDDIFHKDRAKITYNYFKNYPDTDVFYGSFWFCDYKMHLLEYKGAMPYNKKKLLTPREDGRCPQYIGHLTMAYKTKIAKRIPHRKNLRVGIDYPLLVDFAKADLKFGYTKKTLAWARILNTGVSLSRRAEVEKASKI